MSDLPVGQLAGQYDGFSRCEPHHLAADADRLDAAADQAIAPCGGDARAAVKALLIARSPPSGQVTERTRPDALPKAAINEAELAIIPAKNESVCLLGVVVVHGFCAISRGARTKCPESVLALSRIKNVR